MPERMRPLDMTFLTRESASTPMHVATLDIFDPPADGFDYQRLVALIHDRLAFLPRYRQRVRMLPGQLVNPVWVDDAAFDLGYHVRRSSLPRPGSLEQLRELVARIMSRRLDRNRPLWETYVVEGLDGDRFAILTKSHQVLVDGTTVDLGQLILDDSPDVPPTPEVHWDAERAPNGVELLLESVTESLRHPAVAADNIRGQLVTAGQLAIRARDLLSAIVPRQVVSSSGPLETVLSEQRRFATVETRLSAYRTIRAALGGSVNDVILATIAGALRAWLLTRADPAASSTRIRALVPMSVVDDEFAQPTSLGSQVTPHLLTLPLSETSPIMRLHQVSYAFKTHQETGRAVGATRLTKVAGFAPTTFHMIGSRVAAVASGRAFDLVLTNVPGPQFPLYAAGARMLASYPVLPLLAGHALAIGVTSYDGKVFYGLDADRDALPDLEVLGSCIGEALDELLEASSSTRDRAPRGRVPTKASTKKATTKEPAATKATTKKATTKKPAAKKPAGKKPAGKKAAKKVATKRTTTARKR